MEITRFTKKQHSDWVGHNSRIQTIQFLFTELITKYWQSVPQEQAVLYQVEYSYAEVEDKLDLPTMAAATVFTNELLAIFYRGFTHPSKDVHMSKNYLTLAQSKACLYVPMVNDDFPETTAELSDIIQQLIAYGEKYNIF